MESKGRVPAKAIRLLVALGSSFGGLLILAIGFYGFYATAHAGKIFPNTHVGSVDVSGMTLEAAEATLAEAMDAFKGSALTFSIDEASVTFQSSDVGVTFDPKATAEHAYQRGRHQGIPQNLRSQLSSLVGTMAVPAQFTVDEAKMTAWLDTLSTQYEQAEQNAAVEYVDGAVRVVAEQPGQQFDHAALRSMLERSLQNLAYPTQFNLASRMIPASLVRTMIEPLVPAIERTVQTPLDLSYESIRQSVTPDQLTAWIVIEPKPATPVGLGGSAEFSFDTEKITAYVTTVAGEIRREPIDAKLTIRDGKAAVFQQSRDGWELDVPGTVERIIQALGSRRVAGISTERAEIATEPIQLVVQVKKPTVSEGTIEQLGIKELIGTGKTDFSGSPNNRIHNLTTGTKYMNGWLVKPGEEFSTVAALGAVDASTGYLPELVIKENRTIPEYGGGLCQVSTTLFRAVLNAGLPVTERKNHSYRVSYYEKEVGPGLDATVYLPKPDFKFKNDTPGWILVQGSVSGKTLTFELYGTKDGREAEVQGPFVLSRTPPPAAVYEFSSSLAPGEVRQTEKPHEGAKTSATYIVRRNGQEINRQVFASSYKALPARYLKGPDGGAPAPTPSPEPAPAPAPDLSTETPATESSPAPAETPTP